MATNDEVPLIYVSKFLPAANKPLKSLESILNYMDPEDYQIISSDEKGIAVMFLIEETDQLKMKHTQVLCADCDKDFALHDVPVCAMCLGGMKL